MLPCIIATSQNYNSLHVYFTQISSCLERKLRFFFSLFWKGGIKWQGFSITSLVVFHKCKFIHMSMAILNFLYILDHIYSVFQTLFHFWAVGGELQSQMLFLTHYLEENKDMRGPQTSTPASAWGMRLEDPTKRENISALFLGNGWSQIRGQNFYLSCLGGVELTWLAVRDHSAW